MKHRGQYLYSHMVLSSLLIFLVPLLLFSGGALVLMLTAARSQLTSDARYVLSNAKRSLEGDFNRLNYLASALRSDLLLRYGPSADPVDVLALQTKLVQYAQMNGLVEDILYTGKDPDRFFGMRSLYTVDTFLSIYAPRIGLKAYQFHQILRAATEPGFIFSQETSGVESPYLFFVYPLPHQTDPDRSVTLVFVLPKAGLLESIIPSISAAGSQFLAYNQSEVPLLQSGSLLPTSEKAFLQLGLDTLIEGELSLDGRLHYAFLEKGALGGWTFVYLLPWNLLSLLPESGIAFSVVAVLLLLLSELIFFSLLRSRLYNPAVALTKGVLSLVQIGIDRKNVHDEQALLWQILDPSSPVPHSITAMMEQLGHRQGTALFGVLLIRSQVSRSRVEAALPAQMVVMTPRTEKPGYLLILSVEPSQVAELRRALTNSLFTATLGDLSSDPEQLPHSYRVAQWEEAKGPLTSGVWNPTVLLETLQDWRQNTETLRSGDPRAAHAMLGQMLEQIRLNAYPQVLARNFSALLWKELLAFLLEHHPDQSEHWQQQFLELDWENPEVALPALREILAVNLIQQDKNLPAHSLDSDARERLNAYVQDNWTQPNFSLKEVSDLLQLSPASASVFFHKVYGENLIHYLTRRRIEYAKSLLADGLTVKETVLRVGYQDATSFIRKFKGVTGLTPGEWAARKV